MDPIITEYLKIRLSHMLELCKIINNDLFNFETINHDNVKNYDEILLKYDIIKSNNNKFVCIDDNLKIIDLNEFSLNQIGLMKIKYSSFNIIFPDNKNDLTQDYIDKLKLDLNNIINQIRNYHTNTKTYDKLNYELPYVNNLTLTDKSDLNKYLNTNIQEYLFLTERTHGMINKIKVVSDIYSLIYNIFDVVNKSKQFKKISYGQINRNRIQTISILYYNIYNNSINKINIDMIYKYHRTFLITKLLYMKTYSKDVLETFLVESKYRDMLDDFELKYNNIIENHLI
jgi:hypothetical protein